MAYKSTMFGDASGPIPLDGLTPLSEIEIRRLRKLLIDIDRRAWLRRRIFSIVGWMSASGAGLALLWQGFSSHWK